MTQLMDYKGYQGSIEVSLEDECLFGQIQFIEDTILYDGMDVVALKRSFEDAVDSYIAFCSERGKAAEKPYKGSFNVRIGPDLHRKLAQKARRLGLNMNEYLRQIVQAAVEEQSAAPNEILAVVGAQGATLTAHKFMTHRKVLEFTTKTLWSSDNSHESDTAQWQKH
ncbi:hypothetical protein LMG26690_01341 [Achromobacter animicus]|uniref:HicB family protein n=1 Tax=Achromobacter animicus TaxID=1389935 RepID=A0A6S6ZMR4_9BURK|nr:type II toxin-antitoxin system HicB family antitoxin [Achromobacter animicus]CAB3676229.1 hypothetical protein LMG26690_01341 [Achromobacter animicus]